MFGDVEDWLHRAHTHRTTFMESTHGAGGKVWTSSIETVGDEVVYLLHFNAARLRSAKIVYCEAANAIFNALDHLIAIGAKEAEIERGPQISWPWKMAIDGNGDLVPDLQKALNRLAKAGMHEKWINLVRETFEIHPFGNQFVDIVHEASNSGKHWALVPPSSSVAAVSIQDGLAGTTRIIESPDGYWDRNDKLEFYRGHALHDPIIQIMIGDRITVEGRSLAPDPLTALDYAIRFAEGALQKARKLEV